MMDRQSKTRATLEVFLLVVTILLLSVAVSWYVKATWGPSFVIDEPTLSFVSGTEYNIGEAGQVIVEGRFGNGTVAINDSCEISVWYPDKSVFTVQNSTTSTSGAEYITFITPNATGVYEYQAQCMMVTGRLGVISKSFHVSEFQNTTTARLGRMRAEVTK